jgi:hypothetical protein
MDGFFIDKLNVTQDYLTDGERLPFVGKKGFYGFDLETGEYNKEPFITDLHLEGSYSSKVVVKCNGFRVSVYGNPSRWGRIDNLFGLSTFDDCIAVYNQILEKLGLPAFTKCSSYLLKTAKNGGQNEKVYNGAIIKHVDWTRNLSVGEGNERPFLKALSGHSINRSVKPFLYPNEHTVEWYGDNIQKNGSTYRYIKVYTKTADLLRHQKKNVKGADFEDVQYYYDLIAFTAKTGTLREEHSFKREYLKRHHLHAYGIVKETDFLPELQVITDIRKRLEVSKMHYESIVDQLLNEEVVNSRQAANATMCAYMYWLHGEHSQLSTRQFSTHKRRLLQIGIDISQKLDITRAPLRLKTCEVIEVKPLDMPSWYRQPIVPKPNHLSLVA